MSALERSRLPGVSPLRARQRLPAGLVAETALAGVGVDRLQICPWALREGMLLRRLDTLTTSTTSTTSTRASAVDSAPSRREEPGWRIARLFRRMEFML